MPTGKKVEGPPVLPHLQNPDDRPLYLVIESISELNVQAAKKEITRIIKEELLKLVSALRAAEKLDIKRMVGHCSELLIL